MQSSTDLLAPLAVPDQLRPKVQVLSRNEQVQHVVALTTHLQSVSAVHKRATYSNI